MKHSKQLSKATNRALLLLALIVMASGVYLQLEFHLIHKSNATAVMHQRWNSVHAWNSVIFLIAVTLHLYLHYKWYKTIIGKRLFKKNRVTMGLSLIFMLTTLTGLAAWIVKADVTAWPLHNALVETHDKVAILFILLTVAHTAKRFTRLL